eukprot:1606761-Pleurochrysis_carterae.AAC.2
MYADSEICVGAHLLPQTRGGEFMLALAAAALCPLQILRRRSAGHRRTQAQREHAADRGRDGASWRTVALLAVRRAVCAVVQAAESRQVAPPFRLRQPPPSKEAEEEGVRVDGAPHPRGQLGR